MRKRIRILLNYVVGPVLFIWFSWSIYYKIQDQKDVQQSWQEIVKAANTSNFWNLLFVVLLMLANWGIEARKWQIQTANMEKLSFMAAFKAIFAGQAMGFSTFNRIGEPAGRAIFLREGNRLRGIVLSFVGSMAQIITTFVMGALCLLYLRLNMLDSTHQLPGLSIFWLDSLIYIITVGVSLFSLAYFRMPGLIELLERIPIVTKYRFFVERLEVFSYSQLFRILGYSFIRFFGKNVQSMLKLGRAQGVAIAAAMQYGMSVTEYAPKKVKQSVTGNGNADKEQVWKMLIQILGLKEKPSSYDATDALSVAYCHYLQITSVLKTGSRKLKGWEDFITKNEGRIKR